MNDFITDPDYEIIEDEAGDLAIYVYRSSTAIRFKSKEEVNEFISQLSAMRDAVFRIKRRSR